MPDLPDCTSNMTSLVPGVLDEGIADLSATSLPNVAF